MASTQNYGSQTGPTAGMVVVSLTGLTKGRYNVVAATGIEGTAGAGDNNNMQLLNGAGTVSVILASAGGLGRYTNPTMLVDVASGGTLSVVAVGNAGTAAVYSVLLVATPDALYL